MSELHAEAKRSPDVAGLCLLAFAGGEYEGDSAARRARARVGARLVAEVLQKYLRDGAPKG